LGRFQLIDLNAGCPVPKIMRRGDGAGLLKDPDKLAAIVRAMRSVVRLPLTVKTRIGLKPDRINISEVAQAVEENGADALIIHARAASVRHAGKPDWEWLARIKSERKIPIIGTGGVPRAEHAAEMLRQTGVDGVMIGRAAIGRPWIFRQIRELWAGQTPFQPTMDERLAIMREHLAGLEQNCALEIKVLKSPRLAAEQAACVRFRSHVTRYLLGYRRLRYFTRQLNQLDSFEKMLSAAGEVLAAGRMTDENTGSDETSA